MSSTTEINKPGTQETLVKMVLDAWHGTTKRMTAALDSLTDEELQREASPNRNTGTYLLGHLTAVHDAMLPLLGFGDKLYPHLEKPFIATPDKAEVEKPTVSELRQHWKAVNEKLNQHIAALKPADWFTKHSSVSAEDFEKEPYRNKLNIILGRTNHLNYHLGQFTFVKEKK